MNTKKESICTIKKTFFWVVLIIILIIIGCVLYLKHNEHGTLVVCGKIISDIPIEFDTNTENMLVPLVPVLQTLDYNINQQNDCILISKNGQQFELNLDELTLFKTGGKKTNCLQSPPGSSGALCVRTENDVLVDALTFHGTLFLMESGYKMMSLPQLKLVVVY